MQAYSCIALPHAQFGFLLSQTLKICEMHVNLAYTEQKHRNFKKKTLNKDYKVAAYLTIDTTHKIEW